MGRDIRTERLTEIYELVRAYPLAHKKTFENLDISVEDFVQDVVTNIFRRKGLDDYDEAKSPRGFQALIFRLCKNEVIDIARSKLERKTRLDPETGLPYPVVSLDEELPNSEGDTFTRHETTKTEEGMRGLIIEIMDMIPDRQISPNYRLSYRELFLMSYEKSVEEIADEIGISTSRISQLQKEMGETYVFCRKFMRDRKGEVQAVAMLKEEQRVVEPEPEPEPTPVEKYRAYLLEKLNQKQQPVGA